MVWQIFAGTIQSNVTCQSCGNKSLTFEAFLDLSLSVEGLGSSECPAVNDFEHNHHTNGGNQRKRSRSTSLATISSESSTGEDTTTVGSIPSSSVTTHHSTPNTTTNVTLSDCLRYYTSEEKLNAKIVSKLFIYIFYYFNLFRNVKYVKTIRIVVNNCPSHMLLKYLYFT